MITLFLIGRIIFGFYWLRNAYRHLWHGKDMAGYAASKGVPAAGLSVMVSGLLLAIGGLSILLGVFPIIGLVALLVFLVPVTFMMHAYWKDSDPQIKAINSINFYKNLALIGAVFMMFALPLPWYFALF
ncbi:MAG: DoxX family protein [Patescibacteria group bacterium]|nr:DoxX family protein [Patescibacteria group bacterium]